MTRLSTRLRIRSWRSTATDYNTLADTAAAILAALGWNPSAIQYSALADAAAFLATLEQLSFISTEKIRTHVPWVQIAAVQFVLFGCTIFFAVIESWVAFVFFVAGVGVATYGMFFVHRYLKLLPNSGDTSATAAAQISQRVAAGPLQGESGGSDQPAAHSTRENGKA